MTVGKGDLERGDTAGRGAPLQKGPDEQCEGGVKQKGKVQGRWAVMESQSLRLLRRPSPQGGKVAKMED